MYQEGQTTDVTAKVAELVSQVNHWRNEAAFLEGRITTFKTGVRDWFDEQFTEGDESASIDRDEVNELLDSLAIARLAIPYDVTLTISISATVSAASEEAAIEFAEGELNIEGGELTGFEWELTGSRASES